MRTSILYSVPLALAACRAEPAADDTLVNETTSRQAAAPARATNEQLPDPPAPPPAPSALPGLLPLSEAAIRRELGSGASCALVESGKPLVVAIPGDALVNDGGKLTHLKPNAKDWNSLVRGGKFAAEQLVVEISAGPVRAQLEELIERDTEVSIYRGRRGYKTSHGPSWECGS